MASCRVLVLGLVCLHGAVAWGQQRMLEAKREFELGRIAYDKNDFQGAYDHFKRSYVLSNEPALLYNISSALQGLNRPREAGDALRDYLRAVPADPDRPQIEKRIAALDDSQRLLDREREAKLREEAARVRVASVGDAERRAAAAEIERLRRERAAEEARVAKEREKAHEVEARLTREKERLRTTEMQLERERFQQKTLLIDIQQQQAEKDRKRRRNVGIGVTFAVLGAAGIAIGLGLGLSGGKVTHTPSDLGPITSTP